ncbi:protein of unknown function [Candidatus Promineifilum breve]|uniref:Uncharacterized protein n=1 Tax=Candidatus Promineifilum breve TaxID=1806508 RepID=A0A170PJS5_9CHLR|nr:protein of unknown function [Candidatus Promineifilum breve]
MATDRDGEDGLGRGNGESLSAQRGKWLRRGTEETDLNGLIVIRPLQTGETAAARDQTYLITSINPCLSDKSVSIRS